MFNSTFFWVATKIWANIFSTNLQISLTSVIPSVSREGIPGNVRVDVAGWYNTDCNTLIGDFGTTRKQGRKMKSLNKMKMKNDDDWRNTGASHWIPAKRAWKPCTPICAGWGEILGDWTLEQCVRSLGQSWTARDLEKFRVVKTKIKFIF